MCGFGGRGSSAQSHAPILNTLLVVTVPLLPPALQPLLANAIVEIPPIPDGVAAVIPQFDFNGELVFA